MCGSPPLLILLSVKAARRRMRASCLTASMWVAALQYKGNYLLTEGCISESKYRYSGREKIGKKESLNEYLLAG